MVCALRGGAGGGLRLEPDAAPGRPRRLPGHLPTGKRPRPESPNGADAVEVHALDATDPAHGFEDDHCDTTATTDADTTDTTDTAQATDTGPTDTTDTADPCDPTSRGPAAGESDSDFSAANPPPTGPR